MKRNRKEKLTSKRVNELVKMAAGNNSGTIEYSDELETGLRLVINKAGHANWAVRLTVKNKKVFHQLGNYPDISVKEARSMTATFKQTMNQPDSNLTTRNCDREKQLTLKTFILEHYLPWAEIYKKSADKDAQRCKQYILPSLGEKPLKTTSTFEIQAYLNGIKQHSSDATYNRHRSLLSKIFTLAIDWGVCEMHPVKSIKPLKENNQKQDFLSIDEIKTLLIAAKEDENQTVAALIQFLILTGLRKSEALNLQWSDINTHQKLAFLRETKSGRARVIHLSTAAYSLLQSLQVHQSKSPFVFINLKTGMQLVNPQKAFKRILKRAGLPSHWRIHDLRHFAASVAINNGASLYDVQHMLGHASPNTTQRYAHLSTSRLRDVNEQLAHSIFNQSEQLIQGNNNERY